ncbi:MAG: hydrolase, partial [Arenibacter latericius]|nr:hydrolase [Arenibacter latericius]
MGYTAFNLGSHITRYLSRAIFLPLLYLSPLLVFGQDSDLENDSKEIRAFSINGKELLMDGKVDEAFWMAIPAQDSFLMQEPMEGGIPTEQTQVRIAFDSQNLYIAVICFDSDPSGVKAFQKKRDASLETDDRFRLILDTFMDKRSAYFFEINPLGLR